METSTNFTLTEHQLESFLGDIFYPIYLGFILQQMLLGIIAGLTCLYYSRFCNKDPKFSLYIVGALFILNMLEGGMNFDIMSRTLIIEDGQSYFINLQTWTLWAQPSATAVIVFLVHLFFLERCWNLAKKSRVVLLVAPLVLLSLGFGLAFSISLFNAKPVSLLVGTIPMAGQWLLATFMTDMIIWVVLILTILAFGYANQPKAVRLFNVRVGLQSTTAFICAGLVVLSTLVLFRLMPGTTYYLVCQFSISRVHTITMLATLLGRRSVAQTDGSSASTSLSMQEQNMGITIVTLVEGVV
ncbi:hypothetical protein B0H17DRAFT_1327912 [Mycena rosella]|uniref:Uncharacterized protein n=1 Tax=Mycena rosella TaxID=1033263 RepID=A0AAD7DUX4_MYCRO|nr:hypothetical protein B0H17DRAFT_1327912 [Mycena rosella]